MDYNDFLKTKEHRIIECGKEIPRDNIHPKLFEWQKDIVVWASRKGRCAVFLDTGLGKALSVDTKVFTPTGYRRMGDLTIGDIVIGANGKPTNVIGVYKQGIRDAYRITFSDGANAICDINHLWSVRTKVNKYRKEPYRTLTTASILEAGLVSQEGWRWFIPMVQPIELDAQSLPMNPYLLGALLGDGSLSAGTPSISSADDDLLEKIASLLPSGITLKYRSGYDWGLTQGRKNGHSPNQVTTALRHLGIMGKKSEDKFIPDIYKYSCIQDRISILQGLMDTDGYASHDGNVNYCSVSKRLAEDMVFLVQSLGGKTQIRTKKTTGQLAYQMSISLPNDIVPFTIKRKRNIWKPRVKYFPTRAIVSIESCGQSEMVCIAVDAPDNLYVIEHAIVTHNTFIQLEWARLLGENTLIIAPLSVARQTVREAHKIDMDVQYVREQPTTNGIWITNYEMADQFDYSKFGAVVLDESSILKAISGKTRQVLTELCKDVPYRLCCTATPAPNDYIELGNHTEFLGVCKQSEMLAMFFINANKEHTIVVDDKMYRKKGTNKGGTEWRLKHHAEKPFFKWLSSWAITMTKPSDLGYDDDGFILPPLNVTPVYIHSDYTPKDQLFFTHLHGITDRVKVRKSTLNGKLDKLKEIVSSHDGQWLVWCGLDSESREALSVLDGAVEVKGSDSIEHKTRSIENFQDGNIPILITKGKIAGFGLNLQQAHNMVFLGISDSWELYYQCIRREWRYGQTHPVNAHIIMHEAEAEVYQNILRKDAMAKRLKEKLIEQIGEYERGELKLMPDIRRRLSLHVMEVQMPPRLFHAFISIALFLVAYVLATAILVFHDSTRQFAISMAYVGKYLIGIGGISMFAILVFVWLKHQNKHKNNGKHE